jgi:hypothetical protein
VAEAVSKIATAGGDVVRSYRVSLRGQLLMLCVVPIDTVQANPSGATPQTRFINAWGVCQRQKSLGRMSATKLGDFANM